MTPGPLWSTRSWWQRTIYLFFGYPLRNYEWIKNGFWVNRNTSGLIIMLTAQLHSLLPNKEWNESWWTGTSVRLWTRQVVHSIPTRGNKIANIFISAHWCRGKGRRWVPPLTYYLQIFLESGKRSGLTTDYSVTCGIQRLKKKCITSVNITVDKENIKVSL